MVENKTTEKQLVLSERIFERLLDEREILTKRYDLIKRAKLSSFMKDDMSALEVSSEYLETIKSLQCSSIENRLIQIEGEIEGVKLQISELKEVLEENDDK